MSVKTAMRRFITRRHMIDLREYAQPTGTACKVDRTLGIIYAVKVLGKHSKNSHGIKGAERTEYTTECLTVALPLFEGAPVNINHPPRKDLDEVRDDEDVFGCIRNARLMEDGVYGDLHYLTTHAMAGPIAEAAEKMPHVFAMSPNAKGLPVVRDGVAYITEIAKVHSADIVTRGGTVVSLFESEQLMKTISKAKLAEMGFALAEADTMEEDDTEAVDHLFAAFKKMREEDPEKANKYLKMCQADVPEDDDEAPNEGEKDAKSAAGSASDKEKKEGKAPTSTEESEECAKDKKDMKESLQAKKDKCTKLCNLAGVKPEKALLESLVELPEDKALSLLEHYKTNSRPQRGAPPLRSAGNGTPAHDLSKPGAFARMIRRGGN